MVKRKDGTYGPMVDRRGYLVPVADLDETFVKQNVNKKSYAALRHVRLKMNMITACLPMQKQLMLK